MQIKVNLLIVVIDSDDIPWDKSAQLSWYPNRVQSLAEEPSPAISTRAMGIPASIV
jgi:hypothetical protein